MATEQQKRAALKAWLESATWSEIEDFVDAGLRHKSEATIDDALAHWLRVARLFAYATEDGTWAEFEKLFAIIIRKMIVAERELAELKREPQ